MRTPRASLTKPRRSLTRLRCCAAPHVLVVPTCQSFEVRRPRAASACWHEQHAGARARTAGAPPRGGCARTATRALFWRLLRCQREHCSAPCARNELRVPHARRQARQLDALLLARRPSVADVVSSWHAMADAECIVIDSPRPRRGAHASTGCMLPATDALTAPQRRPRHCRRRRCRRRHSGSAHLQRVWRSHRNVGQPSLQVRPPLCLLLLCAA